MAPFSVPTFRFVLLPLKFLTSMCFSAVSMHEGFVAIFGAKFGLVSGARNWLHFAYLVCQFWCSIFGVSSQIQVSSFTL